MLTIIAAEPSTFQGPGIQFAYPSDWQPTKGQTALFAVTAPRQDFSSPVAPSLNLDVPKLPWHIPGFISVGMVVSGYIDDLKKNQIHDAVVEEQHRVSVCGESARQVTCTGHVDGRPSTDVAIVCVHADRVYIFSADSDPAGCDCARKALEAAVASAKWTK